VSVLNPAWLSDVVMERVVVHWTAGAYDISSNDRAHYHFLIDCDGRAHLGDNPVSGNAREGAAGDVTSHVKNFNTGSIGISVAAMGDAIESPFDSGPWPITKLQFFALCVACAELCAFYRIPVTDTTLLMHGEVEDNCGVVQEGKWDIGRLPFAPDDYKDCADVGAKMRQIVQDIIDGGALPIARPVPRPRRTVTIIIESPPDVDVVVQQVEG